MAHRVAKILVVCSLFLTLLSATPRLYGQAVAIANVTGRVTDPQGAILPGVGIKLTAIETGAVHTATSSDDGLYVLTNLPVGAYTLEATVPGFQRYVQKGIVLQVNDSLQINVGMTVGQVTESIEVQAIAAAVQTQTSNVSQVIDGKRIAELR